jgi:hypothetical protein
VWELRRRCACLRGRAGGAGGRLEKPGGHRWRKDWGMGLDYHPRLARHALEEQRSPAQPADRNCRRGKLSQYKSLLIGQSITTLISPIYRRRRVSPHIRSLVGERVLCREIEKRGKITGSSINYPVSRTAANSLTLNALMPACVDVEKLHRFRLSGWRQRREGGQAAALHGCQGREGC